MAAQAVNPRIFQGIKGPVVLMAWAPITCNGETHYVGVTPNGQFVMVNHDLRAEIVGMALGGDYHECLQAFNWWRENRSISYPPSNGALELFSLATYNLHAARHEDAATTLRALPLFNFQLGYWLGKSGYTIRLAGRLFLGMPETQSLISRLTPKKKRCYHVFVSTHNAASTTSFAITPYRHSQWGQDIVCVRLILPLAETWYAQIYKQGNALHPELGFQASPGCFVHPRDYDHGFIAMHYSGKLHTVKEESSW